MRLAAALALAGGLFACDGVLGIDKLSRGVCNEGEKQCRDDGTPHLCKSGAWLPLEPCGALACKAGECVQECADGETRCPPSNVPQVCVSGAFEDQAPCVGQTCRDGQCVGICAPGEKRCVADTPQSCGADGQWVSGSACDSQQQSCLGGECIGQCVPGDLRCSFDNQPEICGASGDWVPNGPLGDSCACAVMTGEPKPDGAACDDGASCTMVDTCLGGLCNPGADHTWAHWDLVTPGFEVRYAASGEAMQDKLIHRVWQRTAPSKTFTWKDAMAYCACLNDPNDASCAKVAGHPSGWRLPTRIELASTVEVNLFAPAIDKLVFPDVGESDAFWSSSPYAAGGSAWMVSFANGDVDALPVSMTLRARCVR